MWCAGAIKLYVSKEYKEAIPLFLERAANAGHKRAPLVLGISLWNKEPGVKGGSTPRRPGGNQKGMDNGNAAAVRSAV